MGQERVIPKVTGLKEAANDLIDVDNPDNLIGFRQGYEEANTALASQRTNILLKVLRVGRRRNERLMKSTTLAYGLKEFSLVS